jgi:hypothetical protein
MGMMGDNPCMYKYKDDYLQIFMKRQSAYIVIIAAILLLIHASLYVYKQ